MIVFKGMFEVEATFVRLKPHVRTSRCEPYAGWISARQDFPKVLRRRSGAQTIDRRFDVNVGNILRWLSWPK
jgi:hypothetical protein